MTPAASVLIPTRNRRQMLIGTIDAVLKQTVAVEVIVVDDGSTDGTAASIAGRFPPERYPVRLIRHETSAGPTRSRNEAAAVAAADILFTIDDDCLLVSPDTFAQTIAGFDHPRIGAVTIPFINVKQNDTVQYQAPAGTGREIGFMFYGGMVAFRRSAFAAVGGYRTYYFMHVEEPDLSIRLMEAGYVVRLGRGDAIHHLESASRNRHKLHVLGPRNSMLYHWYNTPMPPLLVRLPVTTVGTFLYTFGLKRPDLGLLGVIRGALGIVHEARNRRPVSKAVYSLSRRLRTTPSIPLEEIEAILPPQGSSGSSR